MSYLWAVNSLGKVYTLSTAEDVWVEVSGLEFKRISAHEFFTWAIGGDHQVYIYVPTRDIPIRCRVVTYENERWNPVNGFCTKLLPTDRPHWSSADGLVSLPQEDFHLPSKSWDWEEDWYVEDNLDGQPLEPEGWMYATDFPTTYGPNKTWNSLVRRRKWIRYRRFCATNKWSLIPSIHEDPVLEPFIDIAVGGTEVPGGESNCFAVWAITIQGRILFRYGVTETSPEGNGWVPIKTPEQSDMSQVSVGPTGLTWAVSWNGHALVRTGVTRENIMGNDWVVVEPPDEADPLIQVSVGKNVVWALSKNNTIWFRKGIDGLHSGENTQDAIGTGWTKMYGNLSNISVGIDDQIFGVTADAFEPVIRTGINMSELFGRTWKVIQAPVGKMIHSRSSSSLDSMSVSSHRDSVFTSDSISLSSRKISTISDSMSINSRKISTMSDSVSINSRKISTMSDSVSINSRKISTISAISDPLPRKKNSEAPKSIDMRAFHEEIQGEDSLNVGDVNSNQSISHDRFLSIVNRTGSFSSLDSDSMCADGALMCPMQTVVDHSTVNVFWVWLSASGCAVHSESLPYWFSESSTISKSAVDEPWYSEVISMLKERYKREVLEFSSYPKAIERSTWVKTAACRFFKNAWINCVLELTQHGDSDNKSILTVHYKKEQISVAVNHITCAVSLPDWNRNILVVHTAKKTTKGSPYKFAFTSNDDLEDWLSTLNSACRSINNLPWIPDFTSDWSLTINGDVYVHSSTCLAENDPPVNMKWSLLGGGHLRMVSTCPAGIAWGLGYNCTAWVYTKGYGGGPYRGMPGANASTCPMSDIRCLYIYENQRWNPLSGFTAKGLPTDRYMWSDETGRIECTKENTHLPSGHWQWISDWCVDYKTPGGVDNEGWQYATDFPRSYHGYKRFTDYVRRRRWYRKCKLSTTGPWRKLGNTPILDVSFQVDSNSDTDPVAVWAVAINGDVLFRVGVSQNSLSGTNWVHVPSEKPFRSISVGGEGAVWGIAKDGSAQLRHGVSSSSPTGQYWCHIEPPQVGCPLLQISAGKEKVLAVDESYRLWSRQEIVPVYKEGTHWKLVSEDVKQVSVGPMDQIWCIKNSFLTPSGVISGVVCRRKGITEDNPCGSDWEQGIGGCWSYITVRGSLCKDN